MIAAAVAPAAGSDFDKLAAVYRRPLLQRRTMPPTPELPVRPTHSWTMLYLTNSLQ
jgi:hypothetical protein